MEQLKIEATTNWGNFSEDLPPGTTNKSWEHHMLKSQEEEARRKINLPGSPEKLAADSLFQEAMKRAK